MNHIALYGRLTRDLQLKTTKTEKTYTRGAIAVDRPFQKDAVDFFNFTAWGKTAENLARYTGKGSHVILEGRLQQNTYEKNGVEVTTYEVVADTATFLDFKKKDDSDDEDNMPF